ncbi:Uu.00g108570.m01.CDS01 [Anthostomella pinea]|uniref:Uu.00g108570.m01.CDS01 n=1 Tax=Anthostomella pinea TaxID=933095 RepID=A0AAI8YG03_9PEZI|nr:Uu.00g108570.m01.CDS01 [Anthostomella pinea]
MRGPALWLREPSADEAEEFATILALAREKRRKELWARQWSPTSDADEAADARTTKEKDDIPQLIQAYETHRTDDFRRANEADEPHYVHQVNHAEETEDLKETEQTTALFLPR